MSLSMASLATEHRLGPHSVQPVGGSVGAVVVSMQQEMYKDAIHFFREARTATDPFVVWRNIRAAILFSFAAIESCINQFIDAHIEQHKANLPPQKIDWTEKKHFVSIKKKLTGGIELFGGKALDADKDLWQRYKELENLRNGLVHFKVANRLFYNTAELMERTENGIRTAGDVIKAIYLAHPASQAYPKTFDELP
jgi:hypothetical protein